MSNFSYKEYNKICKNCNKEYVAYHNRSIFCSESCLKKYEYKKMDGMKKSKIIKQAGERSKKSFQGKSHEERKAIWTKKNKTKSDKNKLAKYGTTDNNEIRKIIDIKKRARVNSRYFTDKNFYIKSLLYRRINALMRGEARKSKMLDYLGCDIEYFKKYISSKFTNGMGWENQGRGGWHIDHIIPCALFNLSEEEQIKKCFVYTNMQPMWEHDNCSKGAKILPVIER